MSHRGFSPRRHRLARSQPGQPQRQSQGDNHGGKNGHPSLLEFFGGISSSQVSVSSNTFLLKTQALLYPP